MRCVRVERFVAERISDEGETRAQTRYLCTFEGVVKGRRNLVYLDRDTPDFVQGQEYTLAMYDPSIEKALAI